MVGQCCIKWKTVKFSYINIPVISVSKSLTSVLEISLYKEIVVMATRTPTVENVKGKCAPVCMYTPLFKHS